MPHRTALAGASLALVALGSNADAQSRTYTTTADFEEGVLSNVNADPPNADQLQLNPPEATSPLPFINVAASGRGTILRIDVNTGDIVGEYRTAPEGFEREPSRTSVDAFGNVWVGNEGELAGGSVVKIGVVLGGTRVNADGTPNPAGEYLAPPFDYSTCVDRDGDGLIRTSRGVENVLGWPDVTDGSGGAGGGPALVEDAEDECILVFQRTTGSETSHVAVDRNGDVWVGGYPLAPTSFDLLDGTTGAILQTFAAPGCGGFGGLNSGTGVLWSASLAESQVLRYVKSSGASTCVSVPLAYGTALDLQGNVWVTQFGDGVFVQDAVVRIAPDGTPSAPFPTGGGLLDRGVAITPADEHVWVANSDLTNSNVSRLDSAGAQLKVIPLGTDGIEPTGVAVDSNGKVWVTCRESNTAKRIDPNGGSDGLGAVDLTVPLGTNALPFNYSDMTGITGAGIAGGLGFWDVVYDGGVDGTVWDTVSWTSSEPDGSALAVQVRAADDAIGLGARPFVRVQNGVPLTGVTGRRIEVRVDFSREAQSAATPVLFDLTVEAGGGGPQPDGCRPGRRQPGSLLVFPEFDNRLGSQTLLTITNTDPVGPEVDVELVYIGAVGAFGAELDCLEFNDTVTLTPNDTWTALTSAANPGQARGYVYAFAKRFGQPVVHDHLTGSLRVVNGLFSSDFQVNPFVYHGIGAPGTPTDDDGDGIRDLDDVEYSCSSAELLVPRFLGQRPGISSELVLINLTGGAAFTAIADFLIYNDNETVFSAQHAFRCWTKVRLTEVSNAFEHAFLAGTNNNPREVLGAARYEAGWFRVDGNVALSSAAALEDPVLLGFLTEHLRGHPTADLPFERGTQQNGDLLPLGPFGDL